MFATAIIMLFLIIKYQGYISYYDDHHMSDKRPQGGI